MNEWVTAPSLKLRLAVDSLMSKPIDAEKPKQRL